MGLDDYTGGGSCDAAAPKPTTVSVNGSSTFDGNVAKLQGGAIALQSGTLLLQVFEDQRNTSSGVGCVFSIVSMYTVEASACGSHMKRQAPSKPYGRKQSNLCDAALGSPCASPTCPAAAFSAGSSRSGTEHLATQARLPSP